MTTSRHIEREKGGLVPAGQPPGRRHEERHEMVIASRAYLALAVVLGLVHLAAHQHEQRLAVYVTTAALVAFAMALSAIVNRPPWRIWIPMVVILALVGIGHLPKSESWLIDGSELPFQVVASSGHLALIVTLVVVLRARVHQHVQSVVADALVLALGAWVLGWVLFSPDPAAERETGVALLVARYLDQPLAVIVLFLLLTLVLADTSRQPSLRWLCLAVAAALTTHLGHTIVASSHHDVSLRLLNTPLVVGALLAGAGFLHPSVRDLFGPSSTTASRPLLARLLITTMALVVPVVALAASAPSSATDRIVRVVSASVLALAVMMRVVQLARANQRAQADLVRSARTDPLTRLPNRELVIEHIARALSESWRTDTRPAVLFIDVDRFKTINDSLGHSVGDAVLRTVAERLTAVVSERAVVGRISGDEFVVIDPTTRHPGDALAVAETLLATFAEPMSLRQGDVFISASIGVAIANPSSTTKAEELLRQADTAMYRAKDAGRNRIAMFDDTMLERVTQRLELETALYRALERRELRLYHQPIIDLAAGEVIGFEALMRWERSDGVLVSPAEFIPVAEETGIIVPLGAWALLEALTHLRSWIEDGICSEAASVSVNVSPRQLHDPHFLSVVDEALRRSGMTARHLWLEVTESVMITEPTMAEGTLEALCRMGVRIAVDDFGTGYSSLSLLQQFPIHRIKVDRAFVHGVADDEGARSLVRTIIGMAESLDLDVVAEGVENIAQLRSLYEMGCVKAQGFLISKPVPPDAIRSTVGALGRIADWSMLRSATPAARSPLA